MACGRSYSAPEPISVDSSEIQEVVLVFRRPFVFWEISDARNSFNFNE